MQGFRSATCAAADRYHIIERACPRELRRQHFEQHFGAALGCLVAQRSEFLRHLRNSGAVAVVEGVRDHLEERRAMLIVDPKNSWTVSTVAAGVGSLNRNGDAARNAAISVLFFAPNFLINEADSIASL